MPWTVDNVDNSARRVTHNAHSPYDDGIHQPDTVGDAVFVIR